MKTIIRGDFLQEAEYEKSIPDPPEMLPTRNLHGLLPLF
jgi:hypothetical protein